MSEPKRRNPLATLPHGRVLGWVLNLLVVFNLTAQVILVLLLIMRGEALQAAPVAGGAVMALFILVYLYARWLLPGLKGAQILLLIIFKELAVAVLLGLALGLVILFRWLFA